MTSLQQNNPAPMTLMRAKREAAPAPGSDLNESGLVFKRGQLFASGSIAGADPRWNMALDNWLAESAPLQPGDILLRVYRWEPGAITIGRNQSWERAIDATRLAQGELAIRRITGGRAIFHDSAELTYSVVYQKDTVDESPLSPAEIRTLGFLVAKALELALRGVGLDANLVRRSGVSAHRGSDTISGLASTCFASAARHELLVDSAKVAAGAQRVFGARFFQHGSIKLSGTVGHPALGETPEKISGRFDSKSMMVNDLDLRDAFESVFGLSLSSRELKDSELQAVRERQSSLDLLSGGSDNPKDIAKPATGRADRVPATTQTRVEGG